MKLFAIFKMDLISLHNNIETMWINTTTTEAEIFVKHKIDVTTSTFAPTAVQLRSVHTKNEDYNDNYIKIHTNGWKRYV